MLLYCPQLYSINPCNMGFAELAQDDNDIAEAFLIGAVSLKTNGGHRRPGSGCHLTTHRLPTN